MRPASRRSASVPLLLATLAASAVATETPPPNVLFVVADDLGVDRVAAYHAHPDPGHTPVIDALAAEGVLFRNAYADPLCSPTRANMLTGRYGFRTGVTDALNFDLDSAELPLDAITIAEVLPPAYRSLAFGKWHLSIDALGGATHPLQQGFEHHAGTMDSISPHDESYYAFTKHVDGVPRPVAQYATSDTVDDVLAALVGETGPWFAWVAFNAPHAPFHKPPPSLHTFSLPPFVGQDVPLHVKAAVEAMDTELGRLLDGLGPEVLANTYVVFVGDNGTHGSATTPPSDATRAKGTVWEGGIHVPLVVRGPGVVAGAECGALVNTTDLFATVLELCGGDASSGYDSISLVPYLAAPAQPSLRTYAYSGVADPPGFYPGKLELRAVRDSRFKLMRIRDDAKGIDETHMFDLRFDPAELVDLLATPLAGPAADAYAALSPQLDGLQSPWSLLGGGVPGAPGVPSLVGEGALLGGETSTLVLSRTLAGAPATLVLGPGLFAPFKGGVLVPDPTFGLLVSFAVSPSGMDVIPFVWPVGVPSGSPLYFQCWIVDAGAPFGLAASNGLLATSP